MRVLYTYRRCPYAMRARMALHISEIEYEGREVSLREKPPELLSASPKGTVPVLVLDDGTVIDESLDIMRWALGQRDPEGWLVHAQEAEAVIAENDTSFKRDLDRYKYPNRYEGVDPLHHRASALLFLEKLDRRLQGRDYLFGSTRSVGDIALFPFVRQFAAHDKNWFDAVPLSGLPRWLERNTSSTLFEQIMRKA